MTAVWRRKNGWWKLKGSNSRARDDETNSEASNNQHNIIRSEKKSSTYGEHEATYQPAPDILRRPIRTRVCTRCEPRPPKLVHDNSQSADNKATGLFQMPTTSGPEHPTSMKLQIVLVRCGQARNHPSFFDANALTRIGRQLP